MCGLFWENTKWFPLVAALAKDHLACSGTTCVVKRTLSLAAAVCMPDCGGLNSSTMQRAVGCREWIKAGVAPPEEFGDATELIDKYSVRQGSNRAA